MNDEWNGNKAPFSSLVEDPDYSDLVPLKDARINFWRSADAWTPTEGACLVHGFEPIALSERPDLAGSAPGRTRSLALRAIMVGTLSSVNPDTATQPEQPVEYLEFLPGLPIKKMPIPRQPKEVVDLCCPHAFIRWALSKGIDVPEGFRSLADQPEPEEPSEPELSRPSQRHRERCRAIAALLWEQDPTLTIPEMTFRDEITVHGCEGRNYAETTIRKWINDLNPDRSPGRRPKKTPSN